MSYIEKIISGGQTGVDRAALDVAIFLDIPHGGWCPKDRRAEDGEIPRQYCLRETFSSEYSVRTEQNVNDSDGTLVLFFDDLTGGSLLTAGIARRLNRPLLKVDLNAALNAQEVRNWIETNRIKKLNVAGPRESSVPGINRLAEEFLLSVFQTAKQTKL